jgi:Mannosyl-glycoprotein endo-beta-N-acetylglucosaminidase/LysM domain
MRKRGYTIILFFLAVALAAGAQNTAIINEYINTYKGMAIDEMIRTGVPAAITLAQGIHESGAGRSRLVGESNNHFGIKCKSNWTGESVRHDDDAKGECFRKYPKAEDSFRDHSDFLKNGQRYAFLFQLDPADYTGWANGLKKAGYATNPNYPQVLIKLVEEYNLQEYTLLALGKKQDKGNAAATADQPETEKKYAEAIPPVSIAEEEVEKDRKEAAAKKIEYPAGQFYINDTKVVYVKKGIPYLAIARQYEVDLARLFEFNEIARSEETLTDQLVYLQRKRKTGANEFHIVQPNETWHDIAQLQAIRLESMLELNGLKEQDRPAPGQSLHLKKKTTVTAPPAGKNNYLQNVSLQKN